MKQKEIKNLVTRGVAKEATSGDVSQLMKNGYTEIAISYGVYGMNGGLFKDNTTGELFAITSRSGKLFQLV